MRTDLAGGRFQLTWERVTATYDSDGTLIDAQYRPRGKRRQIFVSFSHRKVRAWLEAQGLQEVKLIKAGILTVKPV